MSAELNAIAETISLLRKIYCASAVDDYGNVVIGESQYPDFFKELLIHTGKLERLAIGNDRYETARLLNPRAWQEAWQLNVSTGKPFDEIVDELKPFVWPNAVLRGKPPHDGL